MQESSCANRFRIADDGVSTLQSMAALQAGFKKKLVFLKAQRPNVWSLLDTVMLNNIQRPLPDFF